MSLKKPMNLEGVRFFMARTSTFDLDESIGRIVPIPAFDDTKKSRRPIGQKPLRFGHESALESLDLCPIESKFLTRCLARPG
jgi:hypothetical protein